MCATFLTDIASSGSVVHRDLHERLEGLVTSHLDLHLFRALFLHRRARSLSRGRGSRGRLVLVRLEEGHDDLVDWFFFGLGSG